MIRQGGDFWHQILQAVAIFDKKLTIFIVIFLTLILLFSKMFSILVFQQYQIY